MTSWILLLFTALALAMLGTPPPAGAQTISADYRFVPFLGFQQFSPTGPVMAGDEVVYMLMVTGWNPSADPAPPAPLIQVDLPAGVEFVRSGLDRNGRPKCAILRPGGSLSPSQDDYNQMIGDAQQCSGNNCGGPIQVSADIPDPLTEPTTVICQLLIQSQSNPAFGITGFTASPLVPGSPALTATIVIPEVVSYSGGFSSGYFGPGLCNLMSASCYTTTTVTDPDPSNNTAAVTTTATPDQAELLVGIASVTPNPVMVGNQVTYQVVVQNNGPVRARNVVLTNSPPAALGFVSGNWVNIYTGATGTCSLWNGVVECILGTVGLGPYVGYPPTPSAGLIGVNLVYTSRSAGNIQNTVAVSTRSSQSNTSDDSASANLNAQLPLSTIGLPKVSVSQNTTASGPQIAVGDLFSYVVRVQNTGDVALGNLQLWDALPPEVELVENGIISDSVCHSLEGGFVYCYLPTLLPGDMQGVIMTVRARYAGVITNAAVVPFSGDVTPQDNISLHRVEVHDVHGHH